MREAQVQPDYFQRNHIVPKAEGSLVIPGIKNLSFVVIGVSLSLQNVETISKCDKFLEGLTLVLQATCMTRSREV